ncbi:MAG: glycoside hydrolase family 5 protein [Pseudomonadota bacterium]
MSRSLFIPVLLMLVACTGRAAPAPVERADIAEAPIQRCVNLSNALEAPVEGEWGYVIEDQHIQLIADIGFDTVRLPVKWSAYTGHAPDFEISPDLLARVDHVLDQAFQANLNVVLDVHHFDALYSDPGGEFARLEAIWRQLSAHYANAPDQLIFELINEPRDQIQVEDMPAINSALLSIVRQKHPDRWVVLGSAEWGSLGGWLDADWPTDDNRLMTTFHYYEPYELTHEGASFLDDPPSFGPEWGSRDSHIKTLAAHFSEATEKAAHDGLPVLVGEFGVYRGVSMTERASWVRAVREQSEAAGFAWCHWGFASAFQAWDPQRETWHEEIIAALGLSLPLRGR